MRFYENKNGWWWDDGIFTVNEALALMLYGEAGTEVTYDSKGNYSIPKDIKDAAAFQWQSHCQGGWNSSECFSGYWSYYQAIYTSAPMDTYTVDLHTFKGGVFMSGANGVINHPLINTANTNLPQGWVTIKSKQRLAFEYADSDKNSFAYKIDQGFSIFIVLTTNEQIAFCRKMNLSPKCNLTNAP